MRLENLPNQQANMAKSTIEFPIKPTKEVKGPHQNKGESCLFSLTHDYSTLTNTNIFNIVLTHFMHIIMPKTIICNGF